MICSEKSEKISRSSKPNEGLGKEVECFVTLYPNHYNIPVSRKVYDKVVVGKDYEISLEEKEIRAEAEGKNEPA